jgi:hypothetical protein
VIVVNNELNKHPGQETNPGKKTKLNINRFVDPFRQQAHRQKAHGRLKVNQEITHTSLIQNHNNRQNFQVFLKLILKIRLSFLLGVTHLRKFQDQFHHWIYSMTNLGQKNYWIVY